MGPSSFLFFLLLPLAEVDTSKVFFDDLAEVIDTKYFSDPEAEKVTGFQLFMVCLFVLVMLSLCFAFRTEIVGFCKRRFPAMVTGARVYSHSVSRSFFSRMPCEELFS